MDALLPNLRYCEKTNALIELYNRTEYFGHKLNGFLTLSENIADLGGVAIALAALKKRLQRQALVALPTTNLWIVCFESFIGRLLKLMWSWPSFQTRQPRLGKLIGHTDIDIHLLQLPFVEL